MSHLADDAESRANQGSREMSASESQTAGLVSPHEIVVNRPRPQARVSVILLDWNVRESFHSLYYLNNQTVPRESYDLVWVEFYERRPEALEKAVAEWGVDGPAVDKWVVLNYDEGVYFHKHRMYNVGILAADGDVCVICDSDAMFPEDFVERIVEEFDANPNLVLHLDEVRNNQKKHYPFDFPSFEEVLEPADCINWNGRTTKGLDDSDDMLHEANYGACMCARREDLVAIGGADEHLEYLGYICGPYELTFRLVNHGCTEKWLDDVFLVHTWHPGESGINVDYRGPCDGRGMSSPALEARESGRVAPLLENSAVRTLRQGGTDSLDSQLDALHDEGAPEWREIAELYGTDAEPEFVATLNGYTVHRHACTWYAIREFDGEFSVERFKTGGYRGCLVAHSREQLEKLIEVQPSLTERSKAFAGRIREIKRQQGAVKAGLHAGVRLGKVAVHNLVRLPARAASVLGRLRHRLRLRTRVLQTVRNVRYRLRLRTRAFAILGVQRTKPTDGSDTDRSDDQKMAA